MQPFPCVRGNPPGRFSTFDNFFLFCVLKLNDIGTRLLCSSCGKINTLRVFPKAIRTALQFPRTFSVSFSRKFNINLTVCNRISGLKASVWAKRETRILRWAHLHTFPIIFFKKTMLNAHTSASRFFKNKNVLYQNMKLK